MSGTGPRTGVGKFALVFPQTCEQWEPTTTASSHWPGLWQVSLHRCRPHFSTASQARPQWTFTTPHALFSIFFLPQTHCLVTR